MNSAQFLMNQTMLRALNHYADNMAVAAANNASIKPFKTGSPFLMDNLLQHKTQQERTDDTLRQDFQSQFINSQLFFKNRARSPCESPVEDGATVASNDGRNSPARNSDSNFNAEDPSNSRSVCSHCGSQDCDPYYPTCLSGASSLKRPDSAQNEDNCSTASGNVVKPVLKFSVSAILGAENTRRTHSNNNNGELRLFT